MFSRFVVWLLLILVPFQSFASVGLIQCQAPGTVSLQVLTDNGQHAGLPGPSCMETMDQTHRDDSDGCHGSMLGTGSKPAHATSAHHFHKMPCCSDDAVIFSYSLQNSPESDSFQTALVPEKDALASVFLERPRRPPR